MKNNPSNFVITYGETQGANVVGAYGHEGEQTPNLDRLAANGPLQISLYKTQSYIYLSRGYKCAFT